MWEARYPGGVRFQDRRFPSSNSVTLVGAADFQRSTHHPPVSARYANRRDIARERFMNSELCAKFQNPHGCGDPQAPRDRIQRNPYGHVIDKPIPSAVHRFLISLPVNDWTETVAVG